MRIALPKRPRSDTFLKVCLRTIRSSLGRFLAIVGIVALGCGFYAGLQMAGPDMREAANEYYNGCNLYDIRVVSTMGFGTEDVERLKKIPGVVDAMPAISCDVMARFGSGSQACRVSTLDVQAAEEGQESANAVLSDDGEYLNRVLLREGRWPEGPNECVVSADRVVNGAEIGATMEVLFGTRSLDDLLRERTFTIVGLVTSPSYPYTGTFGSTTLGAGMIGEYVYVSPEAFAQAIRVLYNTFMKENAHETNHVVHGILGVCIVEMELPEKFFSRIYLRILAKRGVEALHLDKRILV